MAPPEWVCRRKTMDKSNREGALDLVLSFLPRSVFSSDHGETPRHDSVAPRTDLRSIGEPVLVLLFPSLLTIPLARQGSLDAALFAWLQVVGVTLDFLNDVLLLYLPLKTA
jgi:hypothetical protein